jgi:hypothetical protein
LVSPLNNSQFPSISLLSRSGEPSIIKYEELNSLARDVAKRVLPVPGGPCNKMPIHLPFPKELIKAFK